MRYNDLKTKVKGSFYKEITIDNDDGEITYIFPDTKEFISILKRDLSKKAARKL
jgi:hypothetical protein